MFDFIKDHALKNVWCTPNQDKQLIIEPSRLTPIGGAIRSFKVIWRNIPLPDNTSKWHIYQIGQVHPLILGLFPVMGDWVSFATTSNKQRMICDIYTTDGIQLPRVESFYMYDNDRDLIIAIKENPKINFDFDHDKIFIRVYSNEYFKSTRANLSPDSIFVKGVNSKTTQDILELQISYNNYNLLPGVVYCFVNGYKVNKIDLITMLPGDVGEFIYDSSIIKIVDFRIGNLQAFNSRLDNKRKYLLHYAGVDDNTIDFYDDIDFFILDNYNQTSHRGVYVHKNNEDTIRMLTHRDYSIVAPYVTAYTPKLQDATDVSRLINPNDLVIRLHIRKSGYFRSLINENNRIKELYKLSDTDIPRAMLGLDSTIDNWNAITLENADYVRLMRSNCNDITNTMVQDGYGYNSISKIIGDTPQKPYVNSGRKTVDVPYGLQAGAMAYEYDIAGLLVGYYYHPFGSKYSANHPDTELIEIISGIGSEKTGDVFGYNNVPIPTIANYKVYYCNVVNGLPDNKWVDTTGSDKYNITNNLVKWVDQNILPLIMVRSDVRFLCYDLSLPMSDGELSFTLTCTQDSDGTTYNKVMEVPMGELDIFLNNRPLIRNLDYYLNFPMIVITNKSYLNNPVSTNQILHIRFTGFCDSNLQLTKVNDFGFIEHGVLSNNNKFDIRDDKVLRIVVDGRLKSREDLIFSELHQGVSILNVNNGKPYLVRDIVVPLKGLTTLDTYTLRDKSLKIDKTISDYLTLKIPQPIRPAPSAITNRYPVFSPFICKLIYDLINSKLASPVLNRNFSDNETISLCKPYEYLLRFDPTQDNLKVNSNYVEIHPHNLTTVINVTSNQYKFLERAVKLYCNKRVSLSPFLRIV